MAIYSRKKCILLLVVAAIAFYSCTKRAPVQPVNVTTDGIAIKGYDPVGYLTERRPLKGSPDFEYVYNGARWRFAGESNRKLFVNDPGKYMPKYGGYCAYAVSQNKIADIDPDAWTVFDGKLYLNLNKDVRNLWEKDMQKYIEMADKNWPQLLAAK